MMLKIAVGAICSLIILGCPASSFPNEQVSKNFSVLKNNQINLGNIYFAQANTPLSAKETKDTNGKSDNNDNIKIKSQNVNNTRVALEDTEKNLFEQIQKSIENSAKSVEQTAKNQELYASYLFWLISSYFAIIGSAFVGLSFFFGNSISSFKKDLLDGFDSKVIEALSRTTSGLESSILPLRSSIERARSEIEGWKEKSREWEKVSASFEKYKNIAGDKDKLHAEDFEGALAEASLIEREAVLNDTVSPERRAECLNHLRTIRVGATEKLVTADVAYNASAIGGRLKLGKITEQLAEAAVQLSGNSPVYAARLYRHKVEARSGEDSDAAFNEMMKLVRQRPQATCELIYSEGWNVAEHLRRYRPLIDALEQGADVEAPFEDSTTPRLNHGQPFENAFNELTSYGHAIAAQCYAREGVFGWEIGYKKHHQLAVEKLKTESPMSTWYAHTKRDLNKLSQRLEAGIAEEEDAGLDIISALARDFVQKQKIQERQDRPKKSRGDKAE